MERRTPWLDWSDADISDLVAESLDGASVARVSRLEGGRANSVFRAELADGSSVVVRAATRDPRNAAKEAALARLLADEPWMPGLLAVTSLHDVAVGLWEYVPAPTLLSAWPSLSAGTLLALVEELGGILGRLRAFRFPEHGDLVAGGDGALAVSRWGFSDDGDERTAFVRHCLFDSPAGVRLGSEVRDRLWTYMQRCAGRRPDSAPVLVHADFGPSNLLVADGRVAAVLDWEFAHAGDPAADLGNLFRARPEATWPDGAEDALARGMRESGVDLPADWAVRARAIDLTSACEFLSSVEDKPKVHARARNQIVQTLDRDF